MWRIKTQTFDLNLKPLNLNFLFHDEMKEKSEWFLDNFSKL
jgi:hypothetical protein